MEQPGYLQPGCQRTRLQTRGSIAARLFNRAACRALELAGPGMKLARLGREYLRCCTTHGPWLGNFLLKAYFAKAVRDSQAAK
jgi:hypothetical protein